MKAEFSIPNTTVNFALSASNLLFKGNVIVRGVAPREVEGYYVVVEGRHFIVPDDAEVTCPWSGERISGIVEVDPASVRMIVR